jgi:hypothetical protein
LRSEGIVFWFLNVVLYIWLLVVWFLWRSCKGVLILAVVSL